MRPPFLMRAIVLAVVVAGTLATLGGERGARYLVVFRDDDVPEGRGAEIGRAGGTLLWSYDRIGVVIADSDDPRSWSG